LVRPLRVRACGWRGVGGGRRGWHPRSRAGGSAGHGTLRRGMRRRRRRRPGAGGGGGGGVGGGRRGPVVEPVGAEDGTGEDRGAGQACEQAGSASGRRAIEDRSRSVAEAALGKNSDDASGFDPKLRLAQGGAVGCAAADRDGVEEGKKPAAPPVRIQLVHGNPVNRAREDTRDQGRVEVADVVGGDKQRPARGHMIEAADPHRRAQRKKRAHKRTAGFPKQPAPRGIERLACTVGPRGGIGAGHVRGAVRHDLAAGEKYARCLAVTGCPSLSRTMRRSSQTLRFSGMDWLRRR